MDHQRQNMVSAEGYLSEVQKREQRARLINVLSRFKPHDANPQQFYNCVRELCIIHNCSIDEGVERAAVTWPRLSEIQRETYNSQRHAQLPIPVPRHLLYRAFEKERNGMWSLGRSTTSGGRHSTRYTLEAYTPPPKPSRIQARLQQRRPKYDNRLDLPPKVAATHVPPPPKPKLSRPSPSSMRRIRSLAPPTIQRVQSIRHILPLVGEKKTARQRLQRKLEKICAPESVADPKASGDGHGAQKKKATKRKSSKTKKLAKSKDLEVIAFDPKWNIAIGSVRRRLMMHEH
ncbi:uncharacterized protein LOC110178779 [Drosophila serrata]|uniref:uncharacterized protein LOC110178779 n=1 Tax=Drosophila serrata TaxID=7274 RepID=UPI000A1D051C|nr:uncharacterized protein LOC110178779 [Drosophila serrata]